MSKVELVNSEMKFGEFIASHDSNTLKVGSAGMGRGGGEGGVTEEEVVEIITEYWRVHYNELKGEKGDKGDNYTITENDYIAIANIVLGNVDTQLPSIVQTYVDSHKEELKGEKGDKGDTPRKGVDYFTPSDVQEIVNDVLAKLPNGEEMSY